MRALVLGRFQPPHRGHFQVLRAAARRYDAVLVAVGSAQLSHMPHNPFTAGERFAMLTAAAAEADLRNVHFFPVPDIHRHAAWVAHVEAHVGDFDVVITNNPLTRRLFTKAGYKAVEGKLWKRSECSGTRIRRLLAEGQDVSSLVPPAVSKVLQQIGGPDRCRSALEVTRAGGRRRH